MAKRFHPDAKVKTVSFGGARVERAADGSFDIPAEHLTAAKAHGFVEPPKQPKQAPAAQPAAPKPLESESTPVADKPSKRGRR
jgi:hypothetical protein